MQYRRLGRSGLQISELTLGTMNFGGPTDAATALRIVDAAIDAGVNLLDCADVYAEGRSEEIVGKAMQSGAKRAKVLVTTKACLPTGSGPNDCGNSRHHLIDSCMTSLKRLRTDVIDIFFLHRTDWRVPQEETLSALHYLVQNGHIRYAACSTHPAWRTVEALHIADRMGYPKFICEQPPYNLLDRRVENEIIPMCGAYDLGLITWSPLAQGVLAGRYRSAAPIPADSRGGQKPIYAERITEAGIQVGQALADRADALATSAAALAVAWVLHQPAVTSVIIGPRTPAHLETLLAAPRIRLSEADLTWCDGLVPPGTFLSDHFNTAGWRPDDPMGPLARWLATR
ncbi:MAG: aldo/keto reductase [Desulfosarcinaceae bacterium]|nr:aldo/keto reductase [Desulfosarcinaceae bacterium]